MPVEKPTPPTVEAWREENQPAIDAHNARIKKHGTLLTPEWSEN